MGGGPKAGPGRQWSHGRWQSHCRPQQVVGLQLVAERQQAVSPSGWQSCAWAPVTGRAVTGPHRAVVGLSRQWGCGGPQQAAQEAPMGSRNAVTPQQVVGRQWTQAVESQWAPEVQWALADGGAVVGSGPQWATDPQLG